MHTQYIRSSSVLHTQGLGGRDAHCVDDVLIDEVTATPLGLHSSTRPEPPGLLLVEPLLQGREMGGERDEGEEEAGRLG